MQAKNLWWAFIIVLLTAPSARLRGRETSATVPSLKKGDPPPGNVLSLSIPQAQTMLKDAITKKYVGTFKSCQRVLMVRGCITEELSPATDFRFRSGGFEFAAASTEKVTAGPLSSDNGRVFVSFKKLGTGEKKGGEIDPLDFIQSFRLETSKGGIATGKANWSPNPIYNVGYFPIPSIAPMDGALFIWTDEAAAREFADAFNRLLYAATQDEEFKTFSAAAKAWRENPSKPLLTLEAERHRVLAENAIKEKNLDSAIEHYQSALEIQPMWPAGWFNLALIYAEQNNYADATDSMKHYLELVPDASDAKDAREQMIIWEDKAKH